MLKLVLCLRVKFFALIIVSQLTAMGVVMKKDFLLLSKSMTTLILLPTLLSLSVIGLSACGGFDDVEAARAAGAGIGSTVTNPNQPVDPEIQSNWRYSSSETEDTNFSVTANNNALNRFVDANTNLRSTP